MATDINEQRRIELEEWCKKEGGILTPERVVELAADPDTHCHSSFEWDNTEAARAYRIIQARTLMRVVLTVVPNVDEPIRAFVSIAEDRKRPSGGYRMMADVMFDPKRREALVKTALIEFKALQHRYKELSELSGVFAAIEHVEQRVGNAEQAEAHA